MNKLQVISILLLVLITFTTCENKEDLKPKEDTYSLYIKLVAYSNNFKTTDTYLFDAKENDQLEITGWRTTINVSKNQDNTFNIVFDFGLCAWPYKFTLSADGVVKGDSKFTDTCGRSDLYVSLTKK